MLASLLGFAALVVLLLLRVPVAFSMVLVGLTGFSYYAGWTGTLAMIGRLTFDTARTSELSVIPLFVLMGIFITRAGLSQQLYQAAYAWIGHRRGGLAMATIISCGGFAAVCGSSLATAATMAKVAMPPMRSYGYADSLAAGAVAAGGTLGILIPPSVILVIYGILTSTDIGALFIAGIIPGIMGIISNNMAISMVTHWKPEYGPPGERTGWRERFRALGEVWGVLVLFVVVIGGIYVGLFTPTESAGIGATGGFLFALLRGRLNLRVLINLLADAAQTTVMIFFVLIGALIFSNLINETGMPEALGAWVSSVNASPVVVIFAIVLIYVLLGSVLDSMAMILLTVPIFFPIVVGLDLNPVWFGIIVVVVTEISLITPPVGMNIFVLNTVLPDVSTATIFKGVTPFWMFDLLRLTLLVLFPSLSLFLPQLMS